MKLVEKTPKFMTCLIGTCPAVYETGHDTYIVIGRKLSKEEMVKFFKGKVGTSEAAVEFPKELLYNILREKS